MEKFNILTTVSFSGYVRVEAESKEEAEKIVKNKFRATLGKCHTCGANQIIYWGFNFDGVTEICNK